MYANKQQQQQQKQKIRELWERMQINKNIEIIKNISEERIKKMAMSKTTFYEILRTHYENNNNKTVAQAIEKMLQDSIK